jgi:PIN domain nuclease of toxin-antitoxin system
LAGDERLSPGARKAIEEGEELYVSAASVWETATKAGLGRLELPEDLESFLLEAMKDPFDRLLVAQAFREGLLDAYGVQRVW